MIAKQQPQSNFFNEIGFQTESLRLGELLGALSYALDLTDGQPEGHCVRCCWIAMQIGERLGMDKTQLFDLYYMVLLKDLGCSSNAARICELFLGDDQLMKREYKKLNGSLPQAFGFAIKSISGNGTLGEKVAATLELLRNGSENAADLMLTRCTRGAEIAEMMRFSPAVCEGIHSLDEHWDGRGNPFGAKGAQIPMLSRIALLCQVADVFHSEFGRVGAELEIKRRSGKWFDPKLVELFLDLAAQPDFWPAFESSFLVEQVFDSDPAKEIRTLDDDYLDEIVLAFSRVIDAKSPFTHGHSERVARYTELICHERGDHPDHIRWMRRIGLLHDIGKLGVSNGVLDKPGKLTENEFDQIKKHALMTEDILSRVEAFVPMARVAGAHHEKLDGSGYPRGLEANDLCPDMRVLVVADIFDALTANRPYRDAMPLSLAYEIMDEMANCQIDKECYALLKKGVARSGLISR